MGLILGIETSTRRCSVALGDVDRIEQLEQDRPREHHALVLSMVRELLHLRGVSLRELAGVAFGRGPGSFTGLRIATSVAQGLAFGAGLRVLPVSSLDALARQARVAGCDDIVVAVDAHMGEMYWAHYHGEGAELDHVANDQLSRVADFVLPAGLDAATTLLAGDAWQVYAQLAPAGFRVCSVSYPTAYQIVAMASRAQPSEWINPEKAEPVYLREANVWKKAPDKT